MNVFIRFFSLLFLLLSITTPHFGQNRIQVEDYLDMIHENSYSEIQHKEFLTTYDLSNGNEALYHLLTGHLAIRDFNYYRAYLELEQALEASKKQMDPILQGEVLYYLSELDFYFYDFNAATDRSILLYEISKELPDKRLLIESAFNLAHSYAYNYDYDEAIEWAEYAKSLSEEVNYSLGDSHYNKFLFYLNAYAGNNEKAILLLKDAYNTYPSSYKHYVATDPKIELQRIIGGEEILIGNAQQGADLLINLLDVIPSNDYVTRYKVNLSLGDYFSPTNLDLSIPYLQQSLADYRQASLIPRSISYESVILEYLGYDFYLAEEYERAAEYLYASINIAGRNESIATIDSVTVMGKLDQLKNEKIHAQITLLEQLNTAKKERIRTANQLALILTISLILITIAFLVTFIEYRQKRKTEVTLYKTSITDNLTQLYNRGHILSIFEKDINEDAAILILDIDNFKVINDTHGHIVGDQVLKEIASVLKTSIRQEDAIGRYGGEEFLIYFNDISLEDLKSIAENIRKNIEDIQWTYPDLITTASIGIVTCFSNDTETVLHQADLLMYQAKNSGKNKVCSTIYPQ